jgi:hypothetical protein
MTADRSFLRTGLNPVTGWVYPFLQPVSRALMGVWLWTRSPES